MPSEKNSIIHEQFDSNMVSQMTPPLTLTLIWAELAFPHILDMGKRMKKFQT